MLFLLMFNFVNNIVYNWVHRTADGGEFSTMSNFINNYYKPGPLTPKGAPETLSSRSSVKESCIQDIDNKFILSLHPHEHPMASILIHMYGYDYNVKKK